MQILKQSTAVDVIIGPFVDSTDGDTEETALTINAADVKLSKNGQTMAGKSDVTACAHDANGMYNCELDSTDTNTVGTMVIFVHVTGALAVRHEFQIVEEAVYDAMFAANAAGPLQSTDAGRKLDVTAAGTAGIDWGNIENATTVVDLSGTDINLVDTCTTNIDMRGTDSAATAADLAIVDSNVDAILLDTAEIGTAGAGLTDLGGMSTAMRAQVESEANDALVGQGLDHLVNVAVTGTDVTDNSIIAKIVSDSATADFDDYDNTTDSLPALAASIGNIAVGSSSVSVQADSFTGTTVTVASGTVTDTETTNAVYHQLQDVAGTLDAYYEFNVGGAGVASEATIVGRINGSNDTLDGIYAWDWVGSAWDRIGDYIGQSATTDVTRAYSLLTRHTGTGANAGKVRIRFYAASGLTSANLYVDQIFASYAVVSQTVGYDGGAVWVDTVNGTAGTEAYVNGTADNPVDSYADAITIASNVGLTRFEVISGSSITFAAARTNEVWAGTQWTLALGGQDISGTYVIGATVSGIATAPASKPHFGHCEIGTATLPPCRINGGSGFTDTLTLGSAGTYDIVSCNSLVAGSGTPTIDLGAAVGASNLNIRGWSGGMTFNNIQSGDIISMEGVGGTITVNGTGGSINVRGTFENVVDGSSAAVSITQVATLNRASAAGYDLGSVWIDTLVGTAGTINYVNGTADNPVDSLADATTIAASLNYRSFNLLRGSSVTLSQTYQGYSIRAGGASINMGAQDVGGTIFEDALISGTATGSTQVLFGRCKLTNTTIPSSGMLNCSISGTLTLLAGSYVLERCYDSPDAGTSILDFGATTANTSVEVHEWNGNLRIDNLGANGTDEITISMVGPLLTISASCTGGTLNIAGQVEVNDLSGGAVTINRNAQLDRPQITALQSDVTSIKTVTDSAETGAAVTGTLSTTQMSTDLTEVTDDHYIGRLLTFTSGALNKQQTDITDYTGTTKVLTFTALTEAPSDGDTFIIT